MTPKRQIFELEQNRVISLAAKKHGMSARPLRNWIKAIAVGKFKGAGTGRRWSR